MGKEFIMNKYKELDDPLTTITLDIQEDEVNSPEHYQQGTLETIEVVKGMLTQEEFLAYCAGSITKYVSRYRYKGNPSKDLDKATWFLNRLKAELEDDN